MLQVGAKLGPYEILAPLGAGGMGEVWKARYTRLERTVAIKVLRLYYLTLDNKLMAVPLSTSPDFHAGAPVPLFSISIPSAFFAGAYDVIADGTRFLVNSAGSDQGSPPLTLLANWTSELRKSE